MAFPVTAQIHNSAWRPAVEPETRAEVPGEGFTTVQIRDADQFQRVLSNIEQLNALAGWPEDVGLYIDLPGVTEADLQIAALAAEEQAAALAAAERQIAAADPPPADAAADAPPPADAADAPPATDDAATPATPAKTAKKK